MAFVTMRALALQQTEQALRTRAAARIAAAYYEYMAFRSGVRDVRLERQHLLVFD